MGSASGFENLEIWQIARELSKTVYSFTRKDEFKNDRRFVSQITAAVGSIMDNIAEGYERNGNKEFVQFLFIAKGSCGELQSQLYRAFDCGYITQEEFDRTLSQAKKESVQITRFILYLKNHEYTGKKYI